MRRGINAVYTTAFSIYVVYQHVLRGEENRIFQFIDFHRYAMDGDIGKGTI